MDSKKLYMCEECGLHYEDEQTAKECYQFCSEHKACSMEITQYSVERKKLMEKRGSH